MSILEFSESFRAWGRSSWRNVHDCNLCPYFTTSLFLMVNHVRRHRSTPEKPTCENANIETFYCKDCDFQTELTILFKQHINKNHSFKDDLSSEDFSVQNYVCEKCDFETSLLLKWRQHGLDCAGKKENLQSVSSPKENVTYSRKNSHLIKEFACHKCPYKTRYPSDLKRHINGTHLDEQNGEWHLCEECPYKSRYKWNLKKHIISNHSNVHHPEKSKRSCRSKSHLNQIYPDGEWHKTRTRSDLKKSVNNSHLDQENVIWYYCKECQYKTKRRTDLKRHVLCRHLDEDKINWFKCEYCPFKTKIKYSLDAHINGQHLRQCKPMVQMRSLSLRN